jgi:hypothetical protein
MTVIKHYLPPENIGQRRQGGHGFPREKYNSGAFKKKGGEYKMGVFQEEETT